MRKSGERENDSMGFLDWLRKPPTKPLVTVVLPKPVSAETDANLKAVEKKVAELNEKNKLEIKEVSVGYKVSGCRIRKEIVWNTIQERELQKQLLDLHPYTIVNIKEWSEQYIKVYGQEEFDKLKASGPRDWNLVASARYKDFVKGGWDVEPEKYVEPPLKEGYEWVGNPFGTGNRVQRPIQPVPATTVAGGTVSIDLMKVEQSAFKGAFEGTTAALESWAAKAQKDAFSS